MSNKKTNVKQPISEKTKLIIAIVAVLVAAAIVLTIALNAVIPDDNGNTTPDVDPGSSSLTISNGDFAYVTKEALKAGKNPYKAQDWTLYSFSSKNEDTEKISLKLNEEDDVINGIVDTTDWDKVVADGLDLKNPGVHDTTSETLDKRVFVLSAQNTNVGILSRSFTVNSGKAAKITVWVNASGITEGSANIAIHTNSTTSLDVTRDNDKDDQLYAYQYNITGEGWQSFTFYILNRDSGTKYMYLSVSLGNVYTEENASGTLFVDDISYEAISINDFRIDGSDVSKTTNYVFASTDTGSSENAVLENATNDSNVTFTQMTSEEYRHATVVNGKEYSPFIEDNLTIYKLSSNGQYYNPVFLRLAEANQFNVAEDFNKLDILHVTFWIRVDQVNKLANANVLLKKLDGTEWKTISGGSFTAITTSQKVTEDNCGWTQYHLYVTPDIEATTLTMEFYFGNEKGYDASTGFAAEGSMYVTAPTYEFVKATSSGSNTKTVNLTGASTSSGSVTNGTFSDITTASNKPTNWYPVFAGSNALYKDGKGDVIPSGINNTLEAIGATGVERNSQNASLIDDGAKNILKLENALATSQGYVSGSLSLSAKSVYMISFIAKTGEGNPYVYLINNAKSRDDEDVYLAKIESKATTFADDNSFCLAVGDLGDGWTRYYMIVVTGTDSVSARLALFNGDIKGEHPTVGTVYYDQVTMLSIGSYTLDKENDNSKVYTVNYTADGYANFEDIEKMSFENLVVSQPTAEQWEEIKKVPAADDTPADDDTPTDDTTTIDWGLLFGTLSSVILLAALVIVVVVLIYRKNKRKSS